ncbi:MAG: ATP-binding cassette domain-containing protein [Myxococcales bacterium]|nr:ATP-binding cassette domain-containing protein [Myxococcales bacterium]
MSAPAYAVRVRGVSKRFGNHTAVDDVSFDVPTGVIYGVLGPNGAGKSTTLRMMNDIIAPDAGTIELLGGLRPGGDAAARVGFLPEERGLYPRMPVGEMIAFFGELRGLTARDARARAGAWLERLGLAQWDKNKVEDLSKGMQQKVQFAAALIHEPELVILDEPWSGLDPINADVLREVVHELRDAGKTVLFSTHLMEQAEKICEHIFIIARGRTVLEGRLADIKRAAAEERRVALEFATPADRARAAAVLADAALARVRGPDEPDALALEVELAAEVGAQRLLAALVGVDAALRRFEVVTPSLHDIFVDRVGRAAAEVAVRVDGAA